MDHINPRRDRRKILPPGPRHLGKIPRRRQLAQRLRQIHKHHPLPILEPKLLRQRRTGIAGGVGHERYCAPLHSPGAVFMNLSTAASSAPVIALAVAAVFFTSVAPRLR